MTRSAPASSSAAPAASSALGRADGCATSTRRLGREALELRLPVGEQRGRHDQQAGTSGAALPRSAPRFCSPLSSRSRPITWIVLPSPMSSARQAPRPRRERNQSQRDADLLVRTQRRAERPPGLGGGEPSRARAAPASVVAEPRSRGHAATSRRRASAPPASPSATAAPASRRIASRNDRPARGRALDAFPSGRGPRAASRGRPRPTCPAPARGRPCRPGSRATPRRRAARRRRASATEKSSSASRPRAEGGFAPTVTLTSAAGGVALPPVGHAHDDPGRLEGRHVVEEAMRLVRGPRQRLEDLARVDELLQQRAPPAARCTGASRDSSAAVAGEASGARGRAADAAVAPGPTAWVV